jgi:hypothetical protein
MPDSSIQTETHWWNGQRCLTCEHWCGDRDEEWARIREWINEDRDLDMLYSIKSGPCSEGPDGVEPQWVGDGGYGKGGYAEVLLAADFGCVEWEAIDGH